MESSTLLWRGVMVGGIASMLAAWVLGLSLWLRLTFKPFTRNFLLLLLVIDLILGLLFIRTWSGGLTLFLDWLWDLNQEYTLGTMFSTIQLVVIGLVSVTIGLCAPASRQWQRLYWLFLGGGFLFLGFDEYFQIHEWLIGDDRWRLMYGGFGGALVVGSAIMYWQSLRQEWRFFVLLLTGLFIMGLSGIIMEYAVWQSFCYKTATSLVPVCDNFDHFLIFEELFELIGETITLSAFLYFAQQHLTGQDWRRQRRVVIAGTVFSTLGLIGYLWLLPALEMRLWATPVHVEYQGGGLQLVGYQIESDRAHPGDTVGINLYWMASRPISREFSLSLHALTQPDLTESIASVEEPDMGQYPSGAFLPGILVRKSLTLTLPEDLPTPASYRLMLRVWSGNWQRQELNGLDISNTDLPLLTPDSLLITSIPVVENSTQNQAAGDVNYLFDDRFAITYFALPETAIPGGSWPLTFAWHTNEAVEQELTQFVHLIDPASGDYVTGFDQPPFGGRFPTADWPAAVSLWDEWEIALPDNLPTGIYEVFTGVYDSYTIERLSVVDRQGQPFRDNSIYLGRVEIQDRP